MDDIGILLAVFDRVGQEPKTVQHPLLTVGKSAGTIPQLFLPNFNELVTKVLIPALEEVTCRDIKK